MREVASADRALAVDLAVTPAVGAAVIDGRITVLDLNSPANPGMLDKHASDGSVTGVLGRAIAAARRLNGGQPPDRVVVVHPATWGTADCEAVRSAAAAGHPYPVALLPAPVAAARCFRDRYALPPGTSVAVYGIDPEAALVSVLTRTPAGLEQRAQGSGGPLTDRMVDRAVGQALAARIRALAPPVGDQSAAVREDATRTLPVDPQVLAGLRERLAAVDATTVLIPGTGESVTVTRTECAALLGEWLRACTAPLRIAVAGSVPPGGLAAVFLTAGAARTPGLAEAIGAELGFTVLAAERPGEVGLLGALAGAADGAAVLPLAGPPLSPLAPLAPLSPLSPDMPPTVTVVLPDRPPVVLTPRPEPAPVQLPAQPPVQAAYESAPTTSPRVPSWSVQDTFPMRPAHLPVGEQRSSGSESATEPVPAVVTFSPGEPGAPGAPTAPPGRRRGPGPRQRLVLAVVAVLLAGGGTAFALNAVHSSGGGTKAKSTPTGQPVAAPPSPSPTFTPTPTATDTFTIPPTLTVPPTVTATVTPSGTATPSGTPTDTLTTPPQDPAEVTLAYFAAITGKDYQAAWDLGGKNLGETYADFEAGFAHTVRDDATAQDAGPTEASVQLLATQDDGTTQSYTGTFTVVDGEITAAHLQSAD